MRKLLVKIKMAMKKLMGLVSRCRVLMKRDVHWPMKESKRIKVEEDLKNMALKVQEIEEKFGRA